MTKSRIEDNCSTCNLTDYCGDSVSKSPNGRQLDCPSGLKHSLGHNLFLTPCYHDGHRDINSNRSSLTDDKRSSESLVNITLDWSEGRRIRNGMCGPLSWSFFPVVISITASLGFVATYFFAKTNCHIEKWIFPYLSYTGTEYPESMIFGMILNTEGFLGLSVVFLAWRFYRHMGQRGCLNTMGLILGSLSCFGVIIVGNFQVTKAKVPHYIGAGLAFIVGTAYCVVGSILSKRSFRLARPPMKGSSYMAVIRIIVAVVMVGSLTLLSGVGVYKTMSHRNRTGEYPSNASFRLPDGSCRDFLSRKPISVQYIDLLASVTEWLLTACLLVFLSLYAYEFKAFQSVKIVLLDHSGPLRRVVNYSNYQCERFSTPTSRGDSSLLMRSSDSLRHQQKSPPTTRGESGGTFPKSESVVLLIDDVQTQCATSDSGIEDNGCSFSIQTNSPVEPAARSDIGSMDLAKSMPNMPF